MLSCVPRDGYLASLHKGDVILPVDEIEKYRKISLTTKEICITTVSTLNEKDIRAIISTFIQAFEIRGSGP